MSKQRKYQIVIRAPQKLKQNDVGFFLGWYFNGELYYIRLPEKTYVRRWYLSNEKETTIPQIQESLLSRRRNTCKGPNVGMGLGCLSAR